MNFKLIEWSEKNYSNLPWRRKRDLYGTLLSEIMLQQTTVGTVLNRYEVFRKKYPKIKDLAKATEEQVLIDWKGLGYYRRAKNLRKAAIDISERYQGKIPLCKDRLMEINGIGEYTANAILAIGADLPAIALDANLVRVLSRYYAVNIEMGPKLIKHLYNLFAEKKIIKNINKLGPRKVNEALMDVGRVYCQANRTHCGSCPLRSFCKAFNRGQQLTYPKKVQKKDEKHELHLLRLIIKKSNKVLVYQKSEDEWLSKQWEVPTFILKSTDKKLQQYPKVEVFDLSNKLFEFKTGITKYKIVNHVVSVSEKEFTQFRKLQKFQFKDINDEKRNFSTATEKLLEKWVATRGH